MTISMFLSVPGGFVLGSESRQITADSAWLKKFEDRTHDDQSKNDFEVIPGEFPKIHRIGDFGLCYSGVGFYGSWTFDQELTELQDMANSRKYTFRQLAEHLHGKLAKALPDRGNAFYLAGFENGSRVFASGGDKTLSFKDGEWYTMRIAGAVNVLEKLFVDETVRWDEMSLPEALDFVLMTITIGAKYMHWFDKYPSVSGGALYAGVITPSGSNYITFPEYTHSHIGGAAPWKG